MSFLLHQLFLRHLVDVYRSIFIAKMTQTAGGAMTLTTCK